MSDFHAFVSGINQSSDWYDEPREKRPRGLHRLAAKALRELDDGQLECCILLAEGKGALCRGYCVWKRPKGGYYIRGTRKNSERHAVIDGKCSCESGRFRGECIHLEILEEVFS